MQKKNTTGTKQSLLANSEISY